jgi:hypothetical protein
LLDHGLYIRAFLPFLYLLKSMADQDTVMDSPRKKVAYDPDQDPEEKRVLRQKYRVLLKDEEGISRRLDRHSTKERKRT